MNPLRQAAIFSALLLAVSAHSSQGRMTEKKDCGMIPPGGSFDQDCKIISVSPPSEWTKSAKIEGEVTQIECDARTSESQSYKATIKVLKVIEGKVPLQVALQFTRYFDDRVRLGDNGVSFNRGDIAELTLTKYPDYWAIQFPSHKKTIRATAGLLPRCP